MRLCIKFGGISSVLFLPGDEGRFFDYLRWWKRLGQYTDHSAHIVFKGGSLFKISKRK